MKEKFQTMTRFPAMNKIDIYNFLFIKLRIVWHLLFWCAGFFILLSLFSASGGIEKIDIIYTLIFITPIILATYLNLLILIPQYLRQEKFLLFFISEISIIIISASLIYLLFDRWIDLIFKNYYFVSYDDLKTLLLYTSTFILLSTLLKLSKEWFIFIREDREKNIHQLKNLQSQINPHFLLNSLQSIYSLSLNNSDKTSDTVLQLSEILKYSLYETAGSQVDLQRELEVMKDYTDMYKIRLDPIRANIDFKITGEAEDHKIVPLLFLPFIENSFKHGLQGDVKNAFVNIHFDINDNNISFNIENNNGSFDQSEKSIFSGIGIENTKKRLNISYPDKHKLTISETPETFRINLKIKL